MCGSSDKSCRLTVVFWSAVVLAAVVAAIVAIVVNHRHKYLLEKERDEKDADIKECGC